MNSLKKIFSRLTFSNRNRRSKKNKVFEIPYNQDITIDICIPEIQNKTFKISKWYVKVGKLIKTNQIICELESNSITIEFDSKISGRLVYISESKEKLKAGDLICKIEKL